MRILTVDDEEKTATLVSMQLESELEASVDIAPDCATARELLSSGHYDLITLDYQLPDGDGLSLLEEIVGQENAPPMVMLTAHGDEKIAVSAFKLGASGYVVKDARMSTMLVEEARSALARAGQAKAEERYRNVFDNSRNGIAVYEAVRDGEDFVFKDFNKAARAIDGASREDVVGRSVLELFPGVREFGLFEVFQRVWRTGVPEHHPVSRYADERVSGWRDNYVYKVSSGEVVAVYEDVTEQKQSEEALRASEDRYRTLFDNMLEGFAFCRMEYDDDGKPVDWYYLDTNKAFEQLTGLKDVVGKYATEIMPGIKETNPEVFEIYGRVASTGKPEQFEVRVVPLSRDLYIEVFCPEMGFFVAVFKNITDLQAAEEALLEREACLRAITQGAMDAILLIDSKLIISHWNPAAEKLFGFTAEEALGQSIEIMLPELRLKAYRSLLEEFIHTGQRTLTTETPSEMLLAGKHRTEFPAEVSVSRFQIGDEWYAEVIARDMTERKQAEEDLRLKESAISSSINGIAIADMEGRLTYVNRAYLDLRGYESPDEVLGREIMEFLEDEKELVPAMKETIERGGWIGEHRARRKDGSVFDGQFITSVVHDDEGTPVAVLATMLDITEKKEALEAIKREKDFSDAVLQTVGAIVIVTDRTGKLVRVNKAFKELTGYSEEEVLGRDAVEFVTGPEQVEEVASLIESAGELVYPFELMDFPVVTKDGEARQVLLANTAVSDEEGSVDFIISTGIDVTEYRRTQQALQEMWERYKVVSDFTYDWEWWLSLEGEFIYVSPSCERITGYGSDEFIKEPGLLQTIVHSEDREAVEKHLKSVCSAKEPVSIDFRIIRPDGCVRWIEQWCQQVLDPDGLVLGSRASNRDVTDNKRVEEALQRANLELEGYAVNLSHDLKGPVGSASLAFSMLTSALEKVEIPEKDGEKLEEIIRAGKGNVNTAYKIIENLLAMAETGEPQEVSQVSIEETIERVLEENAQMIKEKGITVEVASPLGVVVASNTQIYQLFSNLIRNSIEHNQAQNPLVEISSLDVDGTTQRFIVRDNGQGIPEEILEDVFMPFIKAKSSGTGIGLSTVEKIVRTYGGEIRAYNDNGACFEFTLKDWESEGTV